MNWIPDLLRLKLKVSSALIAKHMRIAANWHVLYIEKTISSPQLAFRTIPSWLNVLCIFKLIFLHLTDTKPELTQLLDLPYWDSAFDKFTNQCSRWNSGYWCLHLLHLVSSGSFLFHLLCYLFVLWDTHLVSTAVKGKRCFCLWTIWENWTLTHKFMALTSSELWKSQPAKAVRLMWRFHSLLLLKYQLHRVCVAELYTPYQRMKISVCMTNTGTLHLPKGILRHNSVWFSSALSEL